MPEISGLNETLRSINESPVECKKMRSMSYKQAKLTKITSALKENLFELTSEDEINEDSNNEIIKQLKEKFAEPSLTMQEKFLILTTLPKSWPARKIQTEFNIPYHTANKSKKLQAEKGILSTPNLKRPSNTIEKETSEIVRAFYEDEDVTDSVVQ